MYSHFLFCQKRMGGKTLASLFFLLCSLSLSLAAFQATIQITDSGSPTYHAHPPGMIKRGERERRKKQEREKREERRGREREKERAIISHNKAKIFKNIKNSF